MANRTPINGEKYRNAPQSLVERILARRVVTEDGCWMWPGDVSHDGYGDAKYRRNGKRPHVYVHRLIYMRLIGDPGDLMELDHLCHEPRQCSGSGDSCPHRRCFNPDHLKPATRRENGLRSNSPSARNSLATECPHGHEYTPENTYLCRSGARGCRECHRLDMAARRAAESDEERAARNGRNTSRKHALRLAEARFCVICGVGISHRSRRSVYCEPCSADQSAEARRQKRKLRAAA